MSDPYDAARRGFPILIGLLLFGLGVPFVLRTADRVNVYLPAALMMRRGEEIYTIAGGYTYPPAMAWLAIPFTYFPTRVATAVWYVVNAGCLVGLARCAWWISGGIARTMSAAPHAAAIAWGLGILLSFRFVTDALDHQQTDLLVAALTVGGCVALGLGWGFLSAALIGVAAGIKATPLLWSGYFVFKRRWAAAAIVVAVAIALNLVPNVLTPPTTGELWVSRWIRFYIATIPDRPPGVWATAPLQNQSLSGTIFRVTSTELAWDGPRPLDRMRTAPMTRTALVGLTYGASAFLVLLSMAVGWMRRTPGALSDRAHLALEASVVLMLMLLLSPASSKAHFVTVIVPAFVLSRLAVLERDTASRIWLAVAFVCAFASNRMISGHTFGITMLWWGGVTWCALALLCGSLHALWHGSRKVVRC